MKKKKAKKTYEIFDGLNDKDRKNIRTALRQVWSWSFSRRLVVKRCELPNGFSKCEQCKKKCPKVFVDHLRKVGDVDAGIIFRMFVPSNKMQGLCKKCHDKKTAEERKNDREAEKGFM